VPSTTGKINSTAQPGAASPVGVNRHRNTKQAKKLATKFDAQARAVAGKFILTAVARKHLDQAWPLAGPALKVDTTYKEWLTGNISVIPFLDPIAGAKFSIQALLPNEADIGVALIPVLFTYGGWAHANNVAGEVVDAEFEDLGEKE